MKKNNNKETNKEKELQPEYTYEYEYDYKYDYKYNYKYTMPLDEIKKWKKMDFSRKEMDPATEAAYDAACESLLKKILIKLEILNE